MAIKEQRINQSTPVQPIDLGYLQSKTEDTIEKLTNDKLDAVSKAKSVIRDVNEGLSEIKAVKDSITNGLPKLDPGAIDKVLTTLLGDSAGGKAADVINALIKMPSSVIGALLQTIKDISCALKGISVKNMVFALAGFFALNLNGLCNPMDTVAKVLTVTEGLLDTNLSPETVKQINKMDNNGVQITTKPAPAGYTVPSKDIAADEYTIEELKGLSLGTLNPTNETIDYDPGLEPGTPYIAKDTRSGGGGSSNPRLSGQKDSKPEPIHLSTLHEVKTAIPPDLVSATNKAVGIGLCESIKTQVTQASVMVIYLCNPHWAITNMPHLPNCLIGNIKSDTSKYKDVITKDLLLHMDNIYPDWYTRVANHSDGIYNGLKDYYESSKPLMPIRKCLIDPPKLTGAQKLRVLSSVNHHKLFVPRYKAIRAQL